MINVAFTRKRLNSLSFLPGHLLIITVDGDCCFEFLEIVKSPLIIHCFVL